jgi:hypothetical protein
LSEACGGVTGNFYRRMKRIKAMKNNDLSANTWFGFQDADHFSLQSKPELCHT